MNGFAINPPRTALVDAKGNVTQEWYRFFVQIQRLLGAPSNPFDDAFLAGQAPHGIVDDGQELVPPVLPSPTADPLVAPVQTFPAADPLVPPAVVLAPVTDLLYPPKYGA